MAINEETKQISIVWGLEDVHHVAPWLSDEEAWEVLKKVYDYHDACYGVCWDTLADTADDMYGTPSSWETCRREKCISGGCYPCQYYDVCGKPMED